MTFVVFFLGVFIGYLLGIITIMVRMTRILGGWLP